MLATRLLPQLASLAGAAVILAGCTVVVEEGSKPRPPRPDRPQMCTMQYDPVCARRGGNTRTFGNACEARASGYRVLHEGPCGQSQRPQACTREFAPVCARRAGKRRTFPNACTARAAGYRVVRPGGC